MLDLTQVNEMNRVVLETKVGREKGMELMDDFENFRAEMDVWAKDISYDARLALDQFMLAAWLNACIKMS